MFSESMTTNERYAACVRKPLEDIYSYQTTSCVQREKEKEGEQGVGSGLLVLCSAANAANAACTSPPGQGPLHESSLLEVF